MKEKTRYKEDTNEQWESLQGMTIKIIKIRYSKNNVEKIVI